MISRRGLFRGGLLAAAGLVCMAHTPYRQWVAYRRKHLLILSDKTDPPSYPLSQAVATTLAEHLPASQARPTRARDLERVAALITTGQLEVALMRPDDAVALVADKPPMDGFYPVELRVLAVLGSHLLICRDDFPDHHAYLVGAAVEEHREEIRARMPELGADAAIPDTLPLHDGVIAYHQGLPPPEPPPDEDATVETNPSE